MPGAFDKDFTKTNKSTVFQTLFEEFVDSVITSGTITKNINDKKVSDKLLMKWKAFLQEHKGKLVCTLFLPLNVFQGYSAGDLQT